jgi:hypothetical protein
MRRERRWSTLGARVCGVFALGFLTAVRDELRRKVGTGREIAEQPAGRPCDIAGRAHRECLAFPIEVEDEQVPAFQVQAPPNFRRQDDSPTFS